jgi:cyclophilin family peptidyl-prolyl cis-trans isomerase
VSNSSKAAKRERQRQNRAAKLEYVAAVEKRKRFWRSVRGFVIILVPIAAVFLFLALRSDGSSEPETTPTTQAEDTTLPAPSGITIDPAKTYTATIESTEGTIEIALDAANAPTSVNNFVYLTKAKFYNGLLFNRAAKDFVIQTGSPTNTTVGDPGYTVQAELPTAAYEIGSVAWAKGGNEPAGTAGSQFFIGTGAGVTSLPQDYGYIGKVTKGLDVAQKIMGFAPATGDGTPTTDVTMKKVTITES